MRDLLDILAAFDALSAEGVPMALATIVAVEGSSYRRPGARMLVAADGRRFGSVSGGCLEADVARRGRGVIDRGEPTLCRYETGDDPDTFLSLDEPADHHDPGQSLGCGGAIEIFIEPISADRPGVVPQLRDALRHGKSATSALIYRVGGVAPFTAGTILSLSSHAHAGPLSRALEGQGDRSLDLDAVSDFRRLLLPGGWIDLLIETHTPPPHLLILGDGPDVPPLLQFARLQGWRTTVAGYRGNALEADVQLYLTDHAEADLSIDPAVAVVVMTHDQRRDARLLRRLAESPPAYVGVLGPLHRTRRLLAAAGLDLSQFGGRLYAPLGLDLGGEGPQRVALSIVAEIAAVLSGRVPTHLRDKLAGIHDAPAAAVP